MTASTSPFVWQGAPAIDVPAPGHLHGRRHANVKTIVFISARNRAVTTANEVTGAKRSYPSAAACARDIGVSDKTIANHVRSGSPINGVFIKAGWNA